MEEGSTDERTGGATSSGGLLSLDHNHPLHLSSTDVPGALSVGIQLVGIENYTLWSRAMEIALLGRNKLGLVDGSVSRSNYEGDLKKLGSMQCDCDFLDYE